MKTAWRMFACTLVLAALPCRILACERALSVQIEHDPPLTYLVPGEPIYGMDAEMVQAIVTEAGCQLHWYTVAMSGARTLRAVQDGEFDILLNASDVPERREYAYFSHPYRDEIVGAFARSDQTLPKLQSLDDAYAANLRVIGPLHGWYGEAYRRLQILFQQRGTLATYKEPVIGVQLLFAKPPRGDILIIDADAYAYWLSLQHKETIHWIMAPINIEPTHLMLSRKSVSDADHVKIDMAIDRLSADGTLKRIEAKYRAAENLRVLAANKKPKL